MDFPHGRKYDAAYCSSKVQSVSVACIHLISLLLIFRVHSPERITCHRMALQFLSRSHGSTSLLRAMRLNKGGVARFYCILSKLPSPHPSSYMCFMHVLPVPGFASSFFLSFSLFICACVPLPTEPLTLLELARRITCPSSHLERRSYRCCFVSCSDCRPCGFSRWLCNEARSKTGVVFTLCSVLLSLSKGW